MNAVLDVLRSECLRKRAKKPPFRYLVIRNGIPIFGIVVVTAERRF